MTYFRLEEVNEILKDDTDHAQAAYLRIEEDNEQHLKQWARDLAHLHRVERAVKDAVTCAGSMESHRAALRAVLEERAEAADAEGEDADA